MTTATVTVTTYRKNFASDETGEDRAAWIRLANYIGAFAKAPFEIRHADDDQGSGYELLFRNYQDRIRFELYISDVIREGPPNQVYDQVIDTISTGEVVVVCHAYAAHELLHRNNVPHKVDSQNPLRFIFNNVYDQGLMRRALEECHIERRASNLMVVYSAARDNQQFEQIRRALELA